MSTCSRKIFAVVGMSVLACTGIDAWAGSAASLEVVESVPQETTLAVPGIRDPQTVWLEMIRGAQHTIDLEQFYVTSQAGEALEPVLNAIHDAAARGVRVRLLVDSKFYRTYPDDVNSLAQTPGTEARTIDFSSYGGIQHAKYFVVDGSVSFVGSQNFDWRALDQIHEVGLRTTDASLGADLERIFEKDWATGSLVLPGRPASRATMPIVKKSAASAPAPIPAAGEANIVASPQAADPSGIGYTGDTLVSMIGAARSSVRVQVMDYTTSVYGSSTPWKTLDTALRQAAARGVHVELAVDDSALKDGKKDLRALARVQGIEVKVATIPQLSSGPIPYARLIHSKYLVADDERGWVGSENWAMDYFMQTRDVGIAFDSPSVASQLAQIFDKLWQSPYMAKP